jgi:hypothetical protein
MVLSKGLVSWPCRSSTMAFRSAFSVRHLSKPGLINKAIKVAHKGDWDRVADEFDDLETLVVTVGKDK